MERYLSSVVAATFSYYKVYKEVDVVDSSFQGVGQVNQITPGSVHLSRSVMSDSLRPHGLHAAPGFPVHHQLPELAQTLAHQVSDAIQPSHPLSSPSPPAFNLSQNQGLLVSRFFASGSQSIGISASAPVLSMNIQD